MKRLILLLKGMAMGAADVIPGVSGGTIALITGIYEELISSIKSIDDIAFKQLITFRIRDFWVRINGNFLVNVLLGILISIFSMAKLIKYLMVNHPIPLWAFFFGLILISVLHVFPSKRNFITFAAFFAGAVGAFWITILTPASTPDTWWFVLFSGAVAICAMILPGISGSFILLIMGKYEYVLHAVETFDIITLAIFSVGCLLGLISFSKLIYWLLRHYENVTLAALAGFMLGSLNKIWPWKIDDSGQVWGSDSHSGFINLWPTDYETVTGDPNQLGLAVIFLLIGVILVVGLTWWGRRFTEKNY